jgi:hypothetical protein
MCIAEVCRFLLGEQSSLRDIAFIVLIAYILTISAAVLVIPVARYSLKYAFLKIRQV